MSKAIEDRISALVGKSEKVKKTGEITKPKKNGGARPGAGRKPKEVNLIARGIKKYLDDHFNEEIQVEIEDPKTREKRIINKPRTVLALEKLYLIGMSGDGNPDALNKWLDRALGKPIQKVVGDEDNPPFRLQINIANILDRAYGADTTGNREVHTEG